MDPGARSQLVGRLSSGPFDLVVIGGGITGAAIAHRGALEGLSVALLEKKDFGAGTTSASSKMLHGGLRYLQHGQVRLVKEALRERGRLVRSLGPSRARTIPFILPLRGGTGRRIKLRFGTWLYEMMAGSLSLGKRVVLSGSRVTELVPSLSTPDLHGGILYHEGIVDDSFLVSELLTRAVGLGAIAVNHIEATGLMIDNGMASGVRFRDSLGGVEGRVRAKCVVNACGVWSGGWTGPGRTPDLRPSKGIHIVFHGERFPLSAAVVIEMPEGRWVFALPYGKVTIVGTTDTEFDGDPDKVRPEPEDIEYLLAAVRREFPGIKVGAEDIIDSYAGLRPLLAGGAERTGDLSREDAVHVDGSGLITSVGGKLTTHDAMAVRTLAQCRKVSGLPPVRTKGEKRVEYVGKPWPGGDWLIALPSGSDRQAKVGEIVRTAIATMCPANLEDVIERRIHPLNRLSPDFPDALGSIVDELVSSGWMSREAGDRERIEYLSRLQWSQEAVLTMRGRAGTVPKK